MSSQFKAALGTYGRALLACLVTELVVAGVPASNADLIKFGHSVWVAFLPVVIRALNPNDSAYGVGA
jgi:hypothetical protein